jgi:hypothetical protein
MWLLNPFCGDCVGKSRVAKPCYRPSLPAYSGYRAGLWGPSSSVDMRLVGEKDPVKLQGRARALPAHAV